MVHDKAFYKKFDAVGPGGRKCSCCYPPPGKPRREVERSWKKRERNWLRKLMLEALED